MARKLSYTLGRRALGDMGAKLREMAASMPGKAVEVERELASVAAEAAQAACPSADVRCEPVVYADGARVVARGPVLRRHRPGSESSTARYTVPLAKVLEFGTGIRGDASYAAEHGYVLDVSGRGSEGWNYPKTGDYNAGATGDGRDTTFGHIHGTPAHGFMRAGAEEARREVPRVAREVLGR